MFNCLLLCWWLFIIGIIFSNKKMLKNTGIILSLCSSRSKLYFCFVLFCFYFNPSNMSVMLCKLRFSDVDAHACAFMYVISFFDYIKYDFINKTINWFLKRFIFLLRHIYIWCTKKMNLSKTNLLFYSQFYAIRLRPNNPLYLRYTTVNVSSFLSFFFFFFFCLVLECTLKSFRQLV